MLGAFRVGSSIDIPPFPSSYKTDNKEQQDYLDNHPRNGQAIGFSEIEKPVNPKDQNSDGSLKKKKFEEKPAPKQEEAPAAETEESKPDSGLAIEDVTNVQLARKYLLDNYEDEVDGRTLTRKDAILEAAAGINPPVEFPNWK